MFKTDESYKDPVISIILLIGIAVILLFLISSCAPSLQQLDKQQTKKHEAQREKLISQHPEWSDHQVNLIRNERINIGFTKDMVRAASGEPSEINTTVTEGNVRQQWVYKYYNDMYFVYFENGKVVGLQK